MICRHFWNFRQGSKISRINKIPPYGYGGNLLIIYNYIKYMDAFTFSFIVILLAFVTAVLAYIVRGGGRGRD